MLYVLASLGAERNRILIDLHLPNIMSLRAIRAPEGNAKHYDLRSPAPQKIISL